MKTILAIAILFSGFFANAFEQGDVLLPPLRGYMVGKAKERAKTICGKRGKLFFPKNYQIHDIFRKVEANEDVIGDEYYYAPILTGVAYCQASKTLIQWTASSDRSEKGHLVFDGITTSVIKVP